MAAFELFPHPFSADYCRHEVLDDFAIVEIGELRGFLLSTDVFA